MLKNKFFQKGKIRREKENNRCFFILLFFFYNGLYMKIINYQLQFSVTVILFNYFV